MPPLSRAELLRQRYRARYGFLNATPHPLPKRRENTQPTGNGWHNWPTNYSPTGQITKENQVRWIEKPDDPAVIVPKIKRQRGKVALTKIAEKVGKKLPVVVGWDRH